VKRLQESSTHISPRQIRNNDTADQVFVSLEAAPCCVTALYVHFYRPCRLRDSPDFSRVDEIRDARLCLIRHEQMICYPEELAAIDRHGSPSERSPLLPLHPILDPDGTIRF
jgi:hypothetical protein